MLQKLDSMNWEFSLKSLLIVLMVFGQVSCVRENLTKPSWLNQIEHRQEMGELEEFLISHLNDTRPIDRVFAGINLVNHNVKNTEFGQGLHYLSLIEKDLEEVSIDSLMAKAYHLRAHIYWSLGLDIRNALEFSKKAIDRVPAHKLSMYEGNHSTYLLEAGEYEEVIQLQTRLQKDFKEQGVNISEAQAVLAVAYYRYAKSIEDKRVKESIDFDESSADSLKVNAYYKMANDLIASSLSDMETLPDLDKQHIYMRAIEVGGLDKAQLSLIMDFAKSKNLYKLELALRENNKDLSVFNETQEEGSARLNKVLRASFENERGLKKQIANYEARRARIDQELAEERASFRQASYLTALFAALLILLISVIFFRAQNSANQAKLEQQDSSILLANYKNRIRPHFLFNQLNNVNGFISQEKWDEAQEYIGLLSVHLRSILENSEEDKTAVQLEFDRIKNYVALQQKSSFAHVDFKVELDIKSAAVKIPSGLLQPLIENSYKYAGNASEKNSWITLTGKTTGDALTITVEDSGYGFLERVPGTGSGLSLVRERIEFNKLKSKRPELWGIETNFGKRKSTVILTMPSKLV